MVDSKLEPTDSKGSKSQDILQFHNRTLPSLLGNLNTELMENFV